MEGDLVISLKRQGSGGLQTSLVVPSRQSQQQNDDNDDIDKGEEEDVGEIGTERTLSSFSLTASGRSGRPQQQPDDDDNDDDRPQPTRGREGVESSQNGDEMAIHRSEQEQQEQEEDNHDNDHDDDDDDEDQQQPLKFAHFPKNLPSISELAGRNRHRRCQENGDEYDDWNEDNGRNHNHNNNNSSESRPLTLSSSLTMGTTTTTIRQRRQKSVSNIVFEESKLLTDTFTFLMTARYPFENCCTRQSQSGIQKSTFQLPKLRRRKEQQVEKLEDDDDDENDVSKENNVNEMIEEDEQELYTAPKRTKLERASSRLRKADSDYLCLPFWVATFVNASQLLIYGIVIASVAFDGGAFSGLPPNADQTLRLAQVRILLLLLLLK